MAVPMTIAQLVNVLYNVVDRMYIGHMEQNAASSLTAIGICMPVTSLVHAFANLYGMGGAPLCAIERGRKNDKEAEAIMGNCFFLLVLTGLVLVSVFCLFRRPLLYAFGASDVTYPYANTYLCISLLGSVFVMITLGMNSFINAQGFGRVGMFTVIIGAVVNIVLDPILIFGFHMGVAGAAAATAFSQFLSAIFVICFLTGKNTLLKLRFETFRLKWSRVKEIITLGTAGFIMQVTNSAVQTVCNSTLQMYGGDLYVGVMTVIHTIREIVSMPSSGLTDGAKPVLGYNYGAEEYGRVRKGIVFMTLSCVIYSTATWIVLMLFTEEIFRLFNKEADMIVAGIPATQIYFFGFYMMSLQAAGQSVFVALGKSRHAICFSILRKIIIVVPLTILLPVWLNNGTDGVFLAEPVSNFIGGLACYCTMLGTVWQELKRKEKGII